jgi:O-acetylserine/cysteine efflux transporter
MMPVRDFAKAMSVMLIWGVSFTVIKVGLTDTPPMLLGALRFVLSAFPAMLFVPRPRVALKWWWAYGLTVGVGQFALLFIAIREGMPAGMASVVLQSQSFFTLIFAAFLLRERWHWPQFAGLAVAGVGLYLLAADAGNSASVGFAPFLLTLGAAAFWGLSNVIVRLAADDSKSCGRFDLLGFLVWTSLIPPLPFVMLSLWLDGPQTVVTALGQLNAVSIGAAIYLAFGGTLLGSGLFTALLTRYPSGQVAPFTLLVPIIGLSTASLVLGEQMTAKQWGGGALVLLGLVVNMLGFAAMTRFRGSKVASRRL